MSKKDGHTENNCQSQLARSRSRSCYIHKAVRLLQRKATLMDYQRQWINSSKSDTLVRATSHRVHRCFGGICFQELHWILTVKSQTNLSSFFQGEGQKNHRFEITLSMFSITKAKTPKQRTQTYLMREK